MKTLDDVANYWYDVAELWEFESLDPDDTIKVIQTAFTSSHCDDFAYVLSEMTGWPALTAKWKDKRGQPGHHALVRSPDGRLLDVTGWLDEAQLMKRYKSSTVSVVEGQLTSPASIMNTDDVELIETAIQQLPYEPHSDDFFQAELSSITSQPNTSENGSSLLS